MTKLTLNQIREHNPCKDSWLELLNHFDKTEADETEVSFQQLIDILNLEDAVWCLRCLPENRKDDIINFTADCAESVLHIVEAKCPDDDRPRKVIEAARNYKNSPEIEFAQKFHNADVVAAGVTALEVISDVMDYTDVKIKEREKQAKFLLKYFGD